MKKFAQAIRSQGVPRRIGRLAVITFVLGVVMSVFALISALNVRSELKDAFGQVARLRLEQTNEREILRRVIDAETAMRGYALTGEEDYLSPFVEARERLVTLRAESPRVRTGAPERYLTFDSTLEASWIGISQAVERLRQMWPDTSDTRARLAGIKQSVDALRAEQDRLDDDLADRLETRRAAANETVTTLLAALGVLALGLVLLAFAQLRELTLQAASYLRSERRAADTISGLTEEVAHSRAALEWVNRQLSITLRSAGIQVFTLDREGNIDWVADEHSRIGPLNAPRPLPAVVPPAVPPVLLETLALVIDHGEERDMELPLVEGQAETRWVRLHLAPQGEGVAMGCAFDISDLKMREENTFWLMRELSHRSKNLLAIVLSIVRQTARSATDKEAFLARFSARLQALAASHDLLVKTDYAGADLGDLIRSQLGGVDHLVGTRIHLSGPPLVIRAEAAQNLGMALHELAANALAHGALSGSEGAVDITWQIAPGEKEPELRLDWAESGHPVPATGNGPGFGDMLIRVNLPRALEGEVTLDHAPEGTRCTMRLPIRRLRPDFQGAT